MKPTTFSRTLAVLLIPCVLQGSVASPAMSLSCPPPTLHSSVQESFQTSAVTAYLEATRRPLLEQLSTFWMRVQTRSLRKPALTGVSALRWGWASRGAAAAVVSSLVLVGCDATIPPPADTEVSKQYVQIHALQEKRDVQGMLNIAVQAQQKKSSEPWMGFIETMAALAVNATSDDPALRLGKKPYEKWAEQVKDKADEAAGTGNERLLILELDALLAEVAAQEEVVKAVEKTVKEFADTVAKDEKGPKIDALNQTLGWLKAYKEEIENKRKRKLQQDHYGEMVKRIEVRLKGRSEYRSRVNYLADQVQPFYKNTLEPTALLVDDIYFGIKFAADFRQRAVSKEHDEHDAYAATLLVDIALQNVQKLGPLVDALKNHRVTKMPQIMPAGSQIVELTPIGESPTLNTLITASSNNHGFSTQYATPDELRAALVQFIPYRNSIVQAATQVKTFIDTDTKWRKKQIDGEIEKQRGIKVTPEREEPAKAPPAPSAPPKGDHARLSGRGTGIFSLIFIATLFLAGCSTSNSWDQTPTARDMARIETLEQSKDTAGLAAIYAGAKERKDTLVMDSVILAENSFSVDAASRVGETPPDVWTDTARQVEKEVLDPASARYQKEGYVAHVTDRLGDELVRERRFYAGAEGVLDQFAATITVFNKSRMVDAYDQTLYRLGTFKREIDQEDALLKTTQDALQGRIDHHLTATSSAYKARKKFHYDLQTIFNNSLRDAARLAGKAVVDLQGAIEWREKIHWYTDETLTDWYRGEARDLEYSAANTIRELKGLLPLLKGQQEFLRGVSRGFVLGEIRKVDGGLVEFLFGDEAENDKLLFADVKPISVALDKALNDSMKRLQTDGVWLEEQLQRAITAEKRAAPLAPERADQFMPAEAPEPSLTGKSVLPLGIVQFFSFLSGFFRRRSGRASAFVNRVLQAA